MQSYINISEEVQQALDNGNPIVALESTIISHGMPYPQNFETACLVEDAVRNEGAIPATIAIIDSKLCVGLTKSQIERVAKHGTNCIKCSRRDIPELILNGGIGTTTVAATMIIADMASIRVFATGGIGGVHRGASKTMDISADLEELSKTDVAVVCAGAKSILDLKMTLEYLETKGVPVLGFQTDEFPAFFSSKSGLKLTQSLNSESELAQFLNIKWNLKLRGGVVIANPIPKEYEADYSLIEKHIIKGLEVMQTKGISGKDITPFMLEYIEKNSEGLSLKANIQLVLNNARLAARIASYL
jgi:pseudouridine-5'-phosphate glycosidase